MAKVSPILRAFNAGEFSELMQGRSDLDRYPASLRSALNFLATPQGPVIRRPGTEYVVRQRRDDLPAMLVEFAFSNTQTFVCEFSDGRIRFLNAAGLLVKPALAASAVAPGAGTISLTLGTGHGLTVGDEVILDGWPVDSGLNGYVAPVAAVSTTTADVTIEAPLDPAASAPSPQVFPVYSVVSPYTAAEAATLRVVQSADVLYLFSETLRPKTLSRYDTYDWRIEDIGFKDGPFLSEDTKGTRLTPSARGGFSTTTTNTTNTPGTSQSLTVETTFTTPSVVSGYTIYLEDVNNADATYSALDYAPSTWTLEALVSATWIQIDRKVGYVLYDNLKSLFFKVENSVTASKVRLTITACRRNGPIVPDYSRIIYAFDGGQNITLTASRTTGINRDNGFSSLDLGRLIRLKSSDGTWTWGEIYRIDSTKQVAVTLKGPPLRDTSPVGDFRLGAFSERTGWPTCGTFLEDRLWLAGIDGVPDLVCASVSSDYSTFSQTDETGAVLDDSAMVFQLNARKLGRVVWLQSDERGLIVGTEAGEFVVRGNDNDAAITPRNLKARPTTAKGSYRAEVVKVDHQVLFIQRSRRVLREAAYVYTEDAYKAPSMSQFATHLGAARFVELAYTAEPHPIVWVLREDGTLLSLTYNRDENVVGWYTHDVGGVIENLAVVPDASGGDDVLYMTVRRGTRRNIERMTATWASHMALANAHFVDAGLRYTGAETTAVSGLFHLAGQTVYGLADGSPVGPLTVSATGNVTLPYAASNVVLGLGYKSRLVTNRLEAGAQDGTAQGKMKRISSVMLRLWASMGGRFGPYIESHGVPEQLETLIHRQPDDSTGALPLFTGDFGPVPFTGHYERSGSMVVEQPENMPLPLNLVAIMPALNTVDG